MLAFSYILIFPRFPHFSQVLDLKSIPSFVVGLPRLRWSSSSLNSGLSGAPKSELRCEARRLELQNCRRTGVGLRQVSLSLSMYMSMYMSCICVCICIYIYNTVGGGGSTIGRQSGSLSLRKKQWFTVVKWIFLM